ncbi:ArsR/SmtB family transcription factor [Salinispora vitiensis]|uniref:ArsR/SmtB family transcription factor n=1 Tax=Salinispora vitiensis TaxID=999544 RepID=UPI00036DA7AF|nr:metalloregulator ArsR/SmtB family transcription factor [Salinispora vitiensis]
MKQASYALDEPERLDATFAALADPTRRAILARLAQGDATVKEIAAPFPVSQPAISRHLKVLESAGLISRGRVAQRRPCHLEGRQLRLVVDWLENYRGYWAEAYGRLDELLDELQAGDDARQSSGGREGQGT